VCDRVGIFAAGKLIGVGTVAELAEQFGEESARIEIGFEGIDPKDYAATATSLKGIPGVSDVHVPGGPGEPFVVLTQPRDATATAREALIKTALAQGLRLSSIREVAPSLDDIYRRALHASGLASPRGAAA
jgi:ABC-type multidrug transport system ATPase subunit